MGSEFENVAFQNNGKLKLLIIVGTRPEIIRLSAVITKCRKYFDTILAHTGQNYDYNLNGVFFKDLKLADPEVYLNAVGADLGETMGNIIAKSYQLIRTLCSSTALFSAHRFGVTFEPRTFSAHNHSTSELLRTL